jgi:hypothetical protein
VTHPIIFRSYGACPIIWGPIVYKHFIPTGLRPFSSKLSFYRGQEQHTRALPEFSSVLSPIWSILARIFFRWPAHSCQSN